MRSAPLVLLAALLLGACASTGTRIASDYATTLCVRNETAAYGLLRIYAGQRSMRVEPGQRECMLIQGSGWIGVRGATIGGGATGPRHVREPIELNGGCWDLAVNNIGTMLLACRPDDRGGTPLAMADTLPPGWLKLLIHEEWGAFTVCATRPKTWYGHEVSHALRPMVEAHEADHRVWMAQFPTCDDYYTWVDASLENQIELEARAFCAGSKADVVSGRFRSLNDAITQAAAWLSHGYLHLALTEAAAEAEIRKYCGPRT